MAITGPTKKKNAANNPSPVPSAIVVCSQGHGISVTNDKTVSMPTKMPTNNKAVRPIDFHNTLRNSGELTSFMALKKALNMGPEVMARSCFCKWLALGGVQTIRGFS